MSSSDKLTWYGSFLKAESFSRELQNATAQFVEIADRAMREGTRPSSEDEAKMGGYLEPIARTHLHFLYYMRHAFAAAEQSQIDSRSDVRYWASTFRDPSQREDQPGGLSKYQQYRFGANAEATENNLRNWMSYMQSRLDDVKQEIARVNTHLHKSTYLKFLLDEYKKPPHERAEFLLDNEELVQLPVTEDGRTEPLEAYLSQDLATYYEAHKPKLITGMSGDDPGEWSWMGDQTVGRHAELSIDSAPLTEAGSNTGAGTITEAGPSTANAPKSKREKTSSEEDGRADRKKKKGKGPAKRGRGWF